MPRVTEAAVTGKIEKKRRSIPPQTESQRDWDAGSHPQSSARYLKTIQTRQHKNDPFILMGDFNATTENPAIKKLLLSGLMTDPGKQQMLTFNQWKSGLRLGLRIDHIFTSTPIKHVTVTVQASGNPPGSDHHPVLATGTIHR